jgi:hypothetical protein
LAFFYPTKFERGFAKESATFPDFVDNKNRKVFMLARVSVVNGNGTRIYDKYVRPGAKGTVTNYHTEISGIRKENLLVGKGDVGVVSFTEAQTNVKRLIKGKILAGHQLDSDFRVSV